MDLSKYCIFVIIGCSFILYVEGVRTETPFLSTKYIGNRDSFTMTCNASSFFNPSIYDWYTINQYKMYRKVESSSFEELLGVLDATKPKKSDPLLKNIPPGRKWEYKYGELDTYNMYITLSVNDATHADVGTYWCVADVKGLDVLLNSSAFSLRAEGEEPVQLLDKKEIGNKDTFTLSCNNTSFRDSNAPIQTTVFRLYMKRQLEGHEEEYIGFLEAFLPPGYDHVAKMVPEGRDWEYSAGGYGSMNNRGTIFITLTVKDATCKDAGYYWCVLNVLKTSYLYNSPKAQLRPKAVNTVTINPIKVTPTKGASFNTSKNDEGDVVTMECTFFGYKSMRPSWSFNYIYNQHNQNVKVFDPERVNASDGCMVYSHKSTKTVVLYRTFRDPIYYCRAFSSGGSDTGVFAVMKFILSGNDDFEESKALATSLNCENKTFLVFLLVVLVICSNDRLIYCC